MSAVKTTGNGVLLLLEGWRRASRRSASSTHSRAGHGGFDNATRPRPDIKQANSRQPRPCTAHKCSVIVVAAPVELTPTRLELSPAGVSVMLFLLSLMSLVLHENCWHISKQGRGRKQDRKNAGKCERKLSTKQTLAHKKGKKKTGSWS